jgi:transcriptional regulator with XRE-family HTH domain
MAMRADIPHDQGLNGAVVRQVKAERAASGMTVDELAAASGIPVRSLVRYLNFERSVDLALVDKLAAGLGLSLEALLTRALGERQHQG